VGGDDHPLGAFLAFIEVCPVLCPGALEPAARLRRNRDHRRDADTRVHGVEKVRTIPIEAIRHHVLERQQALVHDSVQHRCGQLRLGPKGHLGGDLASSPSGGIRLGQPHLRQKEVLVHQGIALP